MAADWNTEDFIPRRIDGEERPAEVMMHDCLANPPAKLACVLGSANHGDGAGMKNAFNTDRPRRSLGQGVLLERGHDAEVSCSMEWPAS
jgi:hypothetical protein